jgi:hypothetical protein
MSGESVGGLAARHVQSLEIEPSDLFQMAHLKKEGST